MSDEPLLRADEVTKHFPVKGGGVVRREVARVQAVDGVSLEVRPGETLGLVGESGCGKSTLGRCLVRLHELTSGSVFFEGRDISQLNRRALRPLRRADADGLPGPQASLNPRKRVGAMIGDPLVIHGHSRRDAKPRVQELMEVVGLAPEHSTAIPHEFSGGQRQRIGVARALALNPRLIVADEPVSALDVSVQAQVVNLLDDLQDEFSLTYVFIAHDLGVVRHVSDRVAVMYLGKIVELSPARGALRRGRSTRTPRRCSRRSRSPTRTAAARAHRAGGRRAEPDRRRRAAAASIRAAATRRRSARSKSRRCGRTEAATWPPATTRRTSRRKFPRPKTRV